MVWMLVRFFFIFIIFLSSINLYSQSLSYHQSIAGYETGATISAGAYKSYLSYFINLNRKNTTKIFKPEMERQIYSWLISRILSPRYIVFQLTTYPLAYLSSELETFHPMEFNRFNFMEMNLLRTVGAGYDEPYALSLLLGNFALFGYRVMNENNKSVLKQSGSALAGIMITTGHFHIQDNIRVDDRWWQFELILTGMLDERNIRKIEWNFRIGSKHHQTDLAPDVVILTVHRSHTEWNYHGLSLIRNSRLHYEAHFPISSIWKHNPVTVRQYFSYGKKFPFKISKLNIVIRLDGGVIWERIRLYNHEERFFEQKKSTQISWLIQPSIEF